MDYRGGIMIGKSLMIRNKEVMATRKHLMEENNILFECRDILNLLKKLYARRILLRYESKKNEEWREKMIHIEKEIASLRKYFCELNQQRRKKGGNVET